MSDSFSSLFLNRFFQLDLSDYSLKPIHKLLLIFFCSRCSNRLEVNCSISDLMFFTSSTKPTVISALNFLSDSGLISVIRSSGTTNVYRLQLDFFPTPSSQHLAYLSGFAPTPPDLPSPSFSSGDMPLDTQETLFSLIKKN